MRVAAIARTSRFSCARAWAPPHGALYNWLARRRRAGVTWWHLPIDCERAGLPAAARVVAALTGRRGRQTSRRHLLPRSSGTGHKIIGGGKLSA